MSTTSNRLKRIILRPRRGNGRLAALAALGGISSSRGEARPDVVEEAQAAGIASPITENKIPDPENAGSYLVSREYWPDPRTVTSSDGLFTFEYQPLQKLEARDANLDPVVFQYQEVDPETGAPYPDP